MALGPTPEALSPTRFFRQGLDPTGRTKRAGFAAFTLILLGLWLLRDLGPGRFETWTRGHEALATVPLAALLVPWVGFVLRRLNDLARPGWWAWALALPWVRWGLLAVLLLGPSSQRRRRPSLGWRVLGLAAAGVVALVLAGSLVWTTAVVADQGMTPALRPGDVALVRRAPVAVGRGDVVAFRLAAGQASLRFGRVVGLGGEAVAVRRGAPVIDGAPARWAEDGTFAGTFGPEGPMGVMPVCGNGPVGLGAECRTARVLETLPDGTTYAVLDAGARPLDTARETIVPWGHFYVMGDHRDAARDSRLSSAVDGTGPVPARAVVGRVDLVLVSTAARAWWDPRGWRPGRVLEPVR